jgi:hypothetical protein
MQDKNPMSHTPRRGIPTIDPDPSAGDHHVGARPIAGLAPTRTALYSLLLMSIIGVVLWGYVVMRAATVGFTTDESYSFLNFVSGRTYGEIIIFPMSAGDHMLNSLCMKGLSSLLGSSALALRAHVVLGYGIYLLACLFIVRDLCSPANRVLAFALLNLNPFLLEFFALARGYGLGLPFMLLSILLLLKCANSSFRRSRLFALSLLCAAVAGIANLVFLIYYIALLFVSLIAIMLESRSDRRNENNPASASQLQKHYAWLAGISSTFFAFVLPQAFRLHEQGDLYYGGEKGFVKDTILSLAKASWYAGDFTRSMRSLTIGLVVLIILIGLLAAIVLAWKTRLDPASQGHLMLLGLLFGAGLSTVALHSVLQVRFLIDREALLFYPLFILAFVVAAQASQLAWRRWYRHVPAVILALFVAGMGFDFVRGANLHSVRIWRFDANTRQMLEDLSRESQRNGQNRIGLGVTSSLEPSISYYARIMNCHWLDRLDRDGLLAARYDYYYVFASDYDKLDKSGLIILKRYEPSGNFLLARVRPPE